MATIYMAPTGSDSTGTGSQLSPVFTFGKAATLMSPADTCLARGGIYPITSYIAGFVGGTSWAATKLFKAYPGEVPIIKPASDIGALLMYFTGAQARYIEWDGFKFDYSNGANAAANVLKFTHDGTIQAPVNGAHHIRLRNCDITNANKDGQGIQFPASYAGGTGFEIIRCRFHHCGLPGNRLVHGMYIGADNSIVEYCEFDHNSGAGMQWWHDGATDVDDNILRYCVAHHNGTAGFITGCGDRTVVHNSIAYLNSEVGFQGWTGGTDSKWYFNTSVQNGSYGFMVHNHTNPVLRNNVAYANVAGAYINDPAGLSTGVTEDHNHFTGVDPKFVDYPNQDFHIRDATSPLINGAVTVAGITVDYDGVTLDASPDIGAFQYVSLASDPRPMVYNQRRRRVFA